MSDPNPDPELKAIEQVIQALGSVKEDARERVVAYVFQRLGLSGPSSPTTPTVPVIPAAPSALAAIPAPAIAHPHGVHDIRSFKNSKNPKTDNEMAALVAYYLKHLAPEGERMDVISATEIEKYFVQANYPLPKQPRLALPNAKAAGYFDSAERGSYKLNPVGHNLVTHGMGQGGEAAAQKHTERKRKNRKK